MTPEEMEEEWYPRQAHCRPRCLALPGTLSPEWPSSPPPRSALSRPLSIWQRPGQVHTAPPRHRTWTRTAAPRCRLQDQGEGTEPHSATWHPVSGRGSAGSVRTASSLHPSARGSILPLADALCLSVRAGSRNPASPLGCQSEVISSASPWYTLLGVPRVYLCCVPARPQGLCPGPSRRAPRCADPPPLPCSCPRANFPSLSLPRQHGAAPAWHDQGNGRLQVRSWSQGHVSSCDWECDCDCNFGLWQSDRGKNTHVPIPGKVEAIGGHPLLLESSSHAF